MEPPPAEGSTPFPRLLPWLLLIGGAIGLAAAGVLTVEKLALLRDRPTSRRAASTRSCPAGR